MHLSHYHTKIGVQEMIVIDTHIWVWRANGSPDLTDQHQAWLEEYEGQGLGVCAISCWEVAKKVEGGKMDLALPIKEWLRQALGLKGILLLPLTPEVAVESTLLPGVFHKDPADQIIVATARIYDCPLLTADEKILDYPHVTCLRGRGS